MGSVQAAPALPGDNAGFGCVSRADAQAFIADFKIDADSFGGVELCKPESDFKKLANDLVVIRDGAFDGQASGPLVGGLVPSDRYYAWMKSETYGIERGQDIPTATAYNSGGYFTMQDGWAASPTLGRVGTVIHEARHTEGYRHRPCTHGPYGGIRADACDASFAEGGSHAVEMEYYARVVLKGRNFHPMYKSMARLMALARANMMFNDSPIRTREALVVKRDDGTTLIDGGQLIERPAAPVDGSLKRASQGAAIWSAQAKSIWALDLYDGALWTAAGRMLDGFSYHKIAMMSWLRPPSPFLDVEEYDFGVARAYLGVLEDGRWSRFDYSVGRWRPWENAASGRPLRWLRAGPDGSPGVGLLTEAGFAKLDLQANRFAQPVPWPSDVAQFDNAGGLTYRLARAGDLQARTAGGGAWQAVALPSPGREMTATPLYDAFEVTK